MKRLPEGPSRAWFERFPGGYFLPRRSAFYTSKCITRAGGDLHLQASAPRLATRLHLMDVRRRRPAASRLAWRWHRASSGGANYRPGAALPGGTGSPPHLAWRRRHASPCGVPPLVPRLARTRRHVWLGGGASSESSRPPRPGGYSTPCQAAAACLSGGGAAPGGASSRCQHSLGGGASRLSAMTLARQRRHPSPCDPSPGGGAAPASTLTPTVALRLADLRLFFL